MNKSVCENCMPKCIIPRKSIFFKPDYQNIPLKRRKSNRRITILLYERQLLLPVDSASKNGKETVSFCPR